MKRAFIGQDVGDDHRKEGKLQYTLQIGMVTYIHPPASKYTYTYTPSNLQRSQHFIDKQPRHPLSRANTHTRQQNPLPQPPGLAQTRNDLSRTRRTQRMPERNGSSPRIHLRGVDLQHILTINGHAGESLVDLDDVDIGLEVQVEFRHELGDGD